jgi:hypothetical protein
MASMRIPSLKIITGGLLAAIFSLYGPPAHAQVVRGCSGILPGTNSIGAVSYRPFTAEWVTTSTVPSSSEGQDTRVMTEYEARDSQGKIRIERRGTSTLADDHQTLTVVPADGASFTVTRAEYGTRIDIYDCSNGTQVQIQPGMKIAMLKEDKSTSHSARQADSHVDLQAPLPGTKSPSNVTVENLGTREIQGVQARGVRMTTIGTEKDGDWNGKPVRETETWVSDELQVRLLVTIRDLRNANRGEISSELINIKRAEPDPTIFEIPKDYEVNPATLPHVKDGAIVRRTGQ